MRDTTRSGPAPGIGLRRGLSWIAASNAVLPVVLILYIAVMAVMVPGFATPGNAANLLSNLAPFLVVAIGQTVVLIVAGVDLSQTATIALASILGAALFTSGVNPAIFEGSTLWGVLLTADGGVLGGVAAAVPFVCLLIVVVGTLVGIFNGLSVNRFSMPPFIVTLVSSTLFSALAVLFTQSENIRNLPDSYTALAGSSGSFVTPSLIIAALVAVGTQWMLTRTLMGEWIYALGTNPGAARVAGVPVGRVTLFAYAFSGTCAGLAAILYTSRLEVASPNVGMELILDIIGAVVIGGTSLYGGKGKVVWTFWGVAFFVVLSNTLNLMNLAFYATYTVKGLVIVAAASVDALRHRWLA